MADRSDASGRARRRDPRGPGPRGSDPIAAQPDPPGDEVAELARRATEAVRDASGPAVAVSGTLRRSGLETRPLVLDGDDGTAWKLLLPPGWSVEAHPGARVTVRGDVSDDVPGEGSGEGPEEGSGEGSGDVTAEVSATSAPRRVLRVRSLSTRG
jgi:hypothetical protein